MGDLRQGGPDPVDPAAEPSARLTQGAPDDWSLQSPPLGNPAVQQAFPPPAVRGSSDTRRTIAILGAVGAVLVAVIVVAAVTVVPMLVKEFTVERHDHASPSRIPLTATDCTDGVSNGDVPTGEMVSAGGLSFPRGVAPRWDIFADPDEPNSIDAVTVQDTVVHDESRDMSWVAHLTIGATNFAQSMSLADQAQLMLKCIHSETYPEVSPTVGALTSTPGRLDGVPTVTVEAPISVVMWDPTITGDDLVLIIVGTHPSTYFLGITPFGDVDRRAVVQAARRELHVSRV